MIKLACISSDSWTARTLLALVLVSTATQGGLGSKRDCEYGRRQTAKYIVDIATRATASIDSFKDDFVSLDLISFICRRA